MKKLLFISFLGIASAIHAQNTYIPDNNFELKLIDLGLDSGPLDDSVLTANINQLTYLNVSGSSIQDLNGIQDFDSLNALLCNQNQLTSLDLSGNLVLDYFECKDNNITSLNISNNTALEWIRCSDNQLTNLDVSNNLQLSTLICRNNPITSFDVSNNVALKSFDVLNNELTTIDVSNNTQLRSIQCSENNLSDLDLSNNNDLWSVRCSDNELSNLDLSNQLLLTTLWCKSNNLTNLDLSVNDSLVQVWCSLNSILSLDLSNKPNLNRIRCTSNNLESLNLTNSNIYINSFSTFDNPNLDCIQVDEPMHSDTAWVGTWFSFDSHHTFGDNCNMFSLEDDLLENAEVYPNPTTNILHVESSNYSAYTIQSVLGKEIIKQGNLGNGNTVLDLSSMSSGMYLLKLMTEKGEFTTKKIMKQ